MHKNLRQSAASIQENSIAPKVTPVEERFYASPLELGSHLARGRSSNSGNEPETAQKDGTRKTSTVVVRFNQAGNTTCYVANLYFYPEHASASRDALLKDLSVQLDAGYVRKIANDPHVARKMLLQSVAEHLQVDSNAFRDHILQFARVTFAALGCGNYVFDLTSGVPTVETLDGLELMLYLMRVPLEITTYFGVMTPSTLCDVARFSTSSVTSMRRPHCQFMPDEVVTSDELIEAATDLRCALKAALEKEIRRLFRESYGEVRVFFQPSTSDTADLIEYLKNIQLILYPSWQEKHIKESCGTWDGMGIEIFELTCEGDEWSTSIACMDDDLGAVVADAGDFFAMAFDFLEDDYARWSQKLDPDRADDVTMTAEELMSAMRFLRRRMGELSTYIARD